MSARCPPSPSSSRLTLPRRRTVSLAAGASSFSPPASSGPGFFLLLLVNLVLFVRPSEILSDLAEWPIYEVVILSCLVVSLPSLLPLFSWRCLRDQPVTLCVLGLLPAIFLSHLFHADLYYARTESYDFGKVVIYYLLLVANVNTTARLRHFLLWLVGSVGILTLLALLQFHEVINIPALGVVLQGDYDPETGEEFQFPRLRSTGIFHDPNDLCLILLMVMAIALYRLSDRRSGFRFSFLVPLGLFGYALSRTASRGGFIGLVVGLLVLFRFRYGWRKTIGLSVLVLPLLFAVFAGRQTRLDVTSGTGQGRIQYWSEGLQLLRQAPWFGIGSEKFVREVRHVAHNSFVHSFAELGLFGGTLFLGAFICAIWMIYRLGSEGRRILDPELARFRPYLLAMTSAFVTGLMALSRSYVVNTYLMLGLVTAFVRISPVYPPLPVLRFDGRLVIRLVLASVVFLIATYIIVRLFAFSD